MTHRSPLVTLAGLVLAFAIMFGVNIANSAQRAGQPANPSPSASASPTPSTEVQSPAATEKASPAATPTKTATQAPKTEQFPNKIVYAGRAKDGSTALAVAVLRDQAAAYVCDGRSVESWLRGTAKDGEVKLSSKSGDKLEAKIDGGVLTGTIEVRNRKHTFAIKQTKKPAGLYRARGSKTIIGWIILEDGSEFGIETDEGGTSKAAPQLNPDQPKVTANGEDLTAAPVEGDEDI
jgi:glucose/arabinose dehydrogenase